MNAGVRPGGKNPARNCQMTAVSRFADMVRDDEVGKSGRTRYDAGKAEMRDNADFEAFNCYAVEA